MANNKFILYFFAILIVLLAILWLIRLSMSDKSEPAPVRTYFIEETP